MKASQTQDFNNESIWWRNPCAALKLIGLAGFWFGDNLFYLTSIGFLDSQFYKISGDPNVNKEQKSKVMKWRAMKSTKAKHFAARCYFAAVLIGLYANFREVLLQREKLEIFQSKLESIIEVENCKHVVDKSEEKKLTNEFEKQKTKYFLRLVALLKVRTVEIFSLYVILQEISINAYVPHLRSLNCLYDIIECL